MPNECHQQLGPRGTINIQLDNINMAASMRPGSDGLSLIVYGIRGNELSFGGGQFVVSSKSGAQAIAPKRVIETEHHADRLNNTRVVQFEDGLRMLSGKTYDIFFDGLPTRDDQFTFSMPSLVMKSREITIPTITFTKITEWRINMVALNC
ncbi:MAG: hypothetical protein NT179_09335 [Nitrospirae bacterium]|nr:hypothetical protein [Nitrospirota bacterium]